MPNTRQTLKTELDSDREEEYNHPDLSSSLHEPLVRHEPQRVWSDDHSGYQKAHKRDEPQESLADVCDCGAGADQCRQLREQVQDMIWHSGYRERCPLEQVEVIDKACAGAYEAGRESSLDAAREQGGKG